MENVARLLERDDFKKRYQSGDSITLTEFIYPLLQAYDSVVLDSDIELGGTDQRFNILLGRQIQKAFEKNQQVALFLPILEGLDGKLKMSKSYQNYIGINEEPKEIFGKIMSISDELMERYIEILYTDSMDEFKGYDNPLEKKKFLAIKLIAEYHTEELAFHAKKDFEEKFSKKSFPSDIPLVKIESGNKTFLELIEEFTERSFSRSEIKRLIKDNAIQINDIKEITLQFIPEKNIEYKIKIGKRNFYKVEFL